ncbi:MAG TPA: TraR/DksA C4-type zinc finger protein [Planctomycetota bacterium]|nr:TraR/DksA C4-type zinc finger protein [Planctomycetota bacterium]
MAQRLTTREIEQYAEALLRARAGAAQDAVVTDDILDALDRIGEGTFGRCELCREWLPRERLQAVPWTRRCSSCEARPAGASRDAGRSTGAG